MKTLITAAMALVAIVSAVPAAAQDSHASECTAEYLTSAREACDSIADVSQLKCDDEACHEALHALVEDEVRQCYVDLGLGRVTDLDYYVQLDEFCHGDGADPAGLSATDSSTAGSNSTGLDSGDATVGDDDHDHDHEETDASTSSSSASSVGNGVQSLSAPLVALPLVTLVGAALNA